MLFFISNFAFIDALPFAFSINNSFEDIIKKSDGTYYTKKLTNCSLVKDENGDWDYVNKLNTNYNDLSELLTTLFLKGGKIEELTKMNTAEIKTYLLNLRKNNVLLKLFMKYFTIDEYKDFTYKFSLEDGLLSLIQWRSETNNSL